MKNILVCAATKSELNCVAELSEKHKFDTALTGIGPIFTTFNLMQLFRTMHYDLVLNIGICGAFSETISIGECLNITSDTFGDLGVTDGDTFRTIFDLHFLNLDSAPFVGGKIFADTHYASLVCLPNVSGITVSDASGEEKQISQRIKKFNADTESMEGAAVFYTCSRSGIPAIQIRSVSNHVLPRNTNTWQIKLALQNLSETLNDVIPLLLSNEKNT